MILPTGALVAVADGETLNLFHNTGHEDSLTLAALPAAGVESGNHGSGARHHTSSANPDHGQVEEDGHSAGVAKLLNAAVLAGQAKHLVVIASPRALGELRRHYSKQLSAVLLKEIDKDLTNHSLRDIENAIAAA